MNLLHLPFAIALTSTFAAYLYAEGGDPPDEGQWQRLVQRELESVAVFENRTPNAEI